MEKDEYCDESSDESSSSSDEDSDEDDTEDEEERDSAFGSTGNNQEETDGIDQIDNQNWIVKG